MFAEIIQKFPRACFLICAKIISRLTRIVRCWEATRARQSPGLADNREPGTPLIGSPAFLFSPAPPFWERVARAGWTANAGPAQCDKSINPPIAAQRPKLSPRAICTNSGVLTASALLNANT